MGNEIIEHRYDGNNALTGLRLNGVEYIYVRNMQGDIMSRLAAV